MVKTARYLALLIAQLFLFCEFWPGLGHTDKSSSASTADGQAFFLGNLPFCHLMIDFAENQ